MFLHVLGVLVIIYLLHFLYNYFHGYVGIHYPSADLAKHQNEKYQEILEELRQYQERVPATVTVPEDPLAFIGEDEQRQLEESLQRCVSI